MKRLHPFFWKFGLLLFTAFYLPKGGGKLNAQPANDGCLQAIQLTDLDNWCSAPDAFSTGGATESSQAAPSCFPLDPPPLDVWFAFTAQATDLHVTVIGNTDINAGGTLNDPQFAVYSGDCTNLTEIACASDAFDQNIIESFAGPLLPGETYYIRVSARYGQTGTFQLCVNNFNQVPSPSSDCATAAVLCDKSPFTVESIQGAGNDTDEVDPSTCMQSEFASVWYKWTCDNPGPLTFTLTPTNPTDDLDFIVYELPNGVDDCSDKKLLRCMASGENIGQPFSAWEPCTGPTGLSLSSADTVEYPGCDPGDDNFLAHINMEAGKSYALVVNNFSNTGNGFSITWGGSGTFVGPKTDFSIEPELGAQCDINMVTFTDETVIPPGMTATSYNWYFGQGANPATATGPGPHDVVYSSFGHKSILLQVETDAGCSVTQVREIYIEPCCDPQTALDIQLDDTQDPACYGESSGSIATSATGGTPGYQFSIDGELYQSIGSFAELPAGEYEIFVQDIKGCMDSVEAVLQQPPPLIVDAGPDQVITLGESVTLEGSIQEALSPAEPLWIAPLSECVTDPLSCYNCLTPLATPLVSDTFYLSATDLDGCSDIDTVFVEVTPVRPVYIPNAFSPNGDGINDYFTAFGGAVATSIVKFQVYSRWGDLLFQTGDIPLNNEKLGWDGRSADGRPLKPGVYAYVIEIAFLDCTTGVYYGDVMLVR